MLRRLVTKTHINARNFTNNQALTRVSSFSTPLQEQYSNAVSVHGTACVYFKKILHGTTCTCTAHSLGNKDNGITVVEPNDIETDYNTPLFAGRNDPIDDSFTEDVDHDLNEGLDMNGMDLFDASIFNNSIDCGICYRTGVIPAYVPLSHSRYVFHTHNIDNSTGYTVEKKYPEKFVALTDDSRVYFLLNVPKTFKESGFRIFNNKIELTDTVFVEDVPITRSDLISAAGTSIRINVRSKEFTHVVFQFRLANLVLIDFPQDQHSLDVTLFDSLGAVQLVVDKSVPSVSSGDIVYNTLLKKFWKVTDYSFFRLNTGKVLGWTITARLVQKDETLINIGNLLNIE